MADEIQIEGMAVLIAKLKDVAPKLRKKAMRMALAAGARKIRSIAREAAPVLGDKTAAGRKPNKYRRPGTLRNAISVRTSKIARQGGDVGVFVSVRPLKRNLRGAKNPNDPFYWRWQEFGWTPASGTRKGLAGRQAMNLRRRASRAGVKSEIDGKGFMTSAAKQLPSTMPIIEARLSAWFKKVQATGKVEE